MVSSRGSKATRTVTPKLQEAGSSQTAGRDALSCISEIHDSIVVFKQQYVRARY